MSRSCSWTGSGRKEHSLNQGEHDRGAGDAERECQHGGSGEPLGAPQQPTGVPNVLLEHLNPAHAVHHVHVYPNRIVQEESWGDGAHQSSSLCERLVEGDRDRPLEVGHRTRRGQRGTSGKRINLGA